MTYSNLQMHPPEKTVCKGARPTLVKRGPYGRVDGTDICDFCGFLYSLHASSGDWKRASEAMNDRYGSMINTVKSPIESGSISEDLSLSALTCANSIKMVA